MLSFDEFINEQYSFKERIYEGGAYGHLMHPFEDFGLTMTDVLNMINTTINGAFGPENFVQEKTDGQQLSISWKDGKLIAARNKSHLRNFGEKALDISGVANLFQGRGDIETVYNAAMVDLTQSIGALSDSAKLKYFENGRKFASLEVITPVTQNTVPYGLNMLVFHGVVEYDENAKVIGEDKQAGRDLGNLVKDANAQSQKTFFVRGPQDLAIQPLPNTEKKAAYYKAKYDKIMIENNLAPHSTIGQYATNRAKILLLEEAKKAGFEIPEEAVVGIAQRLATISKAYNVRTIKKTLSPEAAAWYVPFEKKNAKRLKRLIFAPLENLFIEVGTEFMRNMSSFLSANPTKATEEMRKEIDSVIKKIRIGGGPDEIAKLEHELSRVTAAGGLDAIVPTEGITFIFKGKLYKYTGIFAPIHQIRSMLAYKR
jgi:hypothetical protein